MRRASVTKLRGSGRTGESPVELGVRLQRDAGSRKAQWRCRASWRGAPQKLGRDACCVLAPTRPGRWLPVSGHGPDVTWWRRGLLHLHQQSASSQGRVPSVPSSSSPTLAGTHPAFQHSHPSAAINTLTPSPGRAPSPLPSAQASVAFPKAASVVPFPVTRLPWHPGLFSLIQRLPAFLWPCPT